MPKTLDASLVYCHQVVPEMGLRTDREWTQHANHEAVFVAEGHYRGHVQRETFDLVAGQGLLYPQGTDHRGEATRDGRTRLLLVQWSGAFPTEPQRPTHFADPTGNIRLGLQWLHNLPMDQATRDLQRDALLTTLIEQIRWQLAGSEDFADPIEEMHRFMRTTCDYPITMGILSTRSGLAISTVNQKFRDRYGIPPMRFLQHVRAETAAALIASSTDDLSTIAKQVGLQSGSHLSRLLKKHIGRSARQLRHK